MTSLALLVFAAHRWLPRSTEPPPTTPVRVPGRAVADTLELQIALARLGFSPGAIDGAFGGLTRQALQAYQNAQQLPATGEFDAATQASLEIHDPVFQRVRLTEADFSRIDPPPTSWRERGSRPRMAYHSILEMVAEQSKSDPDLVRQLNPALDFSALAAGDEVITPRVPVSPDGAAADQVRISLSERSLQAIDSHGRIFFHAPVSIARRVDKRPSGELRVKVTVAEPNYTFNPAILSATAEREGITEKFIIQPGPNNPVGTVWIGLDLPSYGIHGTPEPEKVGRTESSGCFRLANWNAETLLPLVRVGTRVYVEP